MRFSTLARIAAALAVCTLFSGCSREEDNSLPSRPPRKEAAAPAQEPDRNVATAAPSGTPPALEQHTGLLEAPGAYVEAVVNAKLTAETKIWLVEARERVKAFEINNDRHPKDLAEASMGVPFHQLPPGMEWQYDPKTGEIDIVTPSGK